MTRVFLFFSRNYAWKLGVRLIHKCGLYTSLYGNLFSLLINVVALVFRFHVDNSFPLCSLGFSTVLFAAESLSRKRHGLFLNKKCLNSKNKQQIVMWRTVADVNPENDVSDSQKWKILEPFLESVERRLFRLQERAELDLTNTVEEMIEGLWLIQCVDRCQQKTFKTVTVLIRRV